MDATLLVTSALAAVLIAGLVAAVALLLAGRRRLEEELRASRAELVALSAGLQEVSAALAAARTPPADAGDRGDGADASASRDVPDTAGFLITSLADAATGPSDTAPVPARRFVSVAAGESLVRLVSLGYGVRRALSPHSRNRIRFEMRQEVRRSRRQRRDEVKEARRLLRARQAGLAQDDAA